MIAFVDSTINDQKNVRISTNIYFRERKLLKQICIINVKKIVANSNKYQSTRRVQNFAAFADLSIIFLTNRVKFDAENKEQLLIAM